ncbi:unnamed protein product [Fraxinus pennsylvanica]|uniref:Uncharacterized protein n=1 Tax=Fraxinus pennsylvanica TaxID=56036 RepID=A0AAD1Z2Y7_9LAMI|nr:unnamed protein product [Fraxinus pennsylvanica]
MVDTGSSCYPTMVLPCETMIPEFCVLDLINLYPCLTEEGEVLPFLGLKIEISSGTDILIHAYEGIFSFSTGGSLTNVLVIFACYADERIRLRKGSLPARHPIVHKESVEVLKRNNNGVEEAIVCKGGHVSGTKKRKLSRIMKDSHHWLPSIHEDYYGPRSHKPKHH